MRLALIGQSISHSRSPALYKKILGEQIQYDLIDVQEALSLPSLETLALKYDGVNITSPYKKNYLDQVTVEDESVHKLGAINTISLSPQGFKGTNTDLLAVREILRKLKSSYSDLHLVILGNGVMASLTKLVAQELFISFTEISRRSHPPMATLDLKPFEKVGVQNIIINACSRDFQFKGQLSSDDIFWDYNYHLIPHQNTLPFMVKEYHDGQEMLFLQAKAAIKFFQINNPKLKC